jgi:hypothetical protein
MTRLDISDNTLCGKISDGSGTYNGAGVAALSDMLRANSVLKELNMSKNYIGKSGAKVLSAGLSGNGALTSLNLASNDLKAKGVKIVAEAIKVTNCAIAVILVPFSCPYDHWLNWCCCLLLSTG